jgi:uncharacterized protein YbcC (UPF0753/DUF2309 family)
VTKNGVWQVHELVSEASTCVNSYWPLSNFIACNALKGMESIPFEQAMHASQYLHGARGFLPLARYRAMYESGRIGHAELQEAFARLKDKERPSMVEFCPTLLEQIDKRTNSNLVSAINRQMIKWLGAYLDKTQAQWKPKTSESLYGFWRELARHDRAMELYAGRNWRNAVAKLPRNADFLLEQCLKALPYDQSQYAAYLQRQILQLPGWASYLKWRQVECQEQDILLDYLAIRLFYEKILLDAHTERSGSFKETTSGTMPQMTAVEEKQNDEDYSYVWQEAYELSYRNQLLSKLSVHSMANDEDKSCCQLVFCIDVRSEPIRRHIEALGPYSTFGFAGFFGMPMRLNELGSASGVDLCPVLLKPNKQVSELSDKETSMRCTGRQALMVSLLQVRKQLKCNLAGAFGLVEAMGFWSALPLLTKTYFPSLVRKASRSFRRASGLACKTYLDLNAFSLSEKLALAEGAIKAIGFERFAKVVVLCGHKSESRNNPYASALDCGACGGNGGGHSARLAAAILNDRAVRSGLSEKGINVPVDTLFVAAEHNTTTDEIEIFGCEGLEEPHCEILDKLKSDLAHVALVASNHRMRNLPQSCLSALNSARARAADWAQIAPEWGLANNAAFIAAPRSATSQADLQGRVFLHSYDCSSDSDGKILELIMTAPLVVAQWINMQYYLSTVDNERFGSGSKVLHNVIGDFGVMQGAAGDLRIGLPLQSLMTPQGGLHEPMRLLAVIRAPVAAIDKVLADHREVEQLVSNRWIRLIALEPHSGEFFEAEGLGKWKIVNHLARVKDLLKAG